MPRSPNVCSQGYIELSYFQHKEQKLCFNILNSFYRVSAVLFVVQDKRVADLQFTSHESYCSLLR